MKMFAKLKGKLLKLSRNTILSASLFAILLVIVVIIVFNQLFIDEQTHSSKAADINSIEYTTDESYQLNIEKNNTWQSNDKYFSEFVIVISNISDTDLVNWDLNLSFQKQYTLEQGWSGKFNSASSSLLNIKPETYNTTILSGSQTTLGFIISSKDEINLEEMCIKLNDTVYSCSNTRTSVFD